MPAARKDKQASSKPKKKNNNNKIKDTTVGFFNDFRYGKAVSVNFFKKNAWLLIIFLSVVLALMGVRYKTKTKMEQIKKLEKELVVSESDKLREKAAYMSLIRETEMLRLVEENNLGLIFQEQPPYEITIAQ
ncbi:MAG: hypothetical protein J1E97_02380 [Muribaculaceae bacterium]|nr:hypothetical protein [Muribaculaceae bacterium]